LYGKLPKGDIGDWVPKSVHRSYKIFVDKRFTEDLLGNGPDPGCTGWEYQLAHGKLEKFSTLRKWMKAEDTVESFLKAWYSIKALG
jgi:hypothetical protein